MGSKYLTSSWKHELKRQVRSRLQERGVTEMDIYVATRPYTLSPEEEDKIRDRRERNKLSAAKCRRNRVQSMAYLKKEYKNLHSENSQLQDACDQLRAEKDELARLIRAHLKTCPVSRDMTSANES